MRLVTTRASFWLVLMTATAWCGAQAQTPAVHLPTSKQLLPVPGAPQRINSLPMGAAVSPDGRYVALLNAGYGTYETHAEQSITLVDTASGKLSDYADERTAPHQLQTLYQGIAFSRDG